MAMNKSVEADGADSASEHDDSTEASACSDEEDRFRTDFGAR